jgi:hypothetical protein
MFFSKNLISFLLKNFDQLQVGEWTSALGLNITDRYAFSEGRPPNITLRVLSRIEEPFVMFRKVPRRQNKNWKTF